MDDMFREGFGRMLADSPGPPDWDELHRPSPLRPEGRGDMLPVARVAIALVVALGLIAAPLLFMLGGDDPEPGLPVPDTVPYVRLSFNQEVDVECIPGLGLEDNEGFDSATIEIWGPSAGDLMRIDITAPDGSVERIVTQGLTPAVAGMSLEELEGLDVQGWSSTAQPDFLLGAESRFRYVVCGGYMLTESPAGFSDLGFVGLPSTLPDGRDYVEGLTASATSRSDAEWRSTPVIVFRFESPEGWIERWLDAEARRFERVSVHTSHPNRGSNTTAFEVLERRRIPLADVSFATDDLYPAWWLMPITDRDGG